MNIHQTERHNISALLIHRAVAFHRSVVTNDPHVIINPTAGGGRARKLLPMIIGEANRLFGQRRTVCITQSPGHAMISARESAMRGARLVLVIGGDGTIHEVVNGLLQAQVYGERLPRLGIVSCGTGHGLAQSLDLPTTVEEQFELASKGMARPMDLGCIIAANSGGIPTKRFFVSECQIGLGAAVVGSVGSFHKALGGPIGFGSAALFTSLRYGSHPMTIHFQDGGTVEEEFLGLTVGNGRYCGGGMTLVPDASVDDGLLDILMIREMSLPKRIVALSRIYTGSHTTMPACAIQKISELTVRSEQRIDIAADGESIGTTPCAIEVIPRAIRVIRPVKTKENI